MENYGKFYTKKKVKIKREIGKIRICYSVTVVPFEVCTQLPFLTTKKRKKENLHDNFC